MPKKKKWNKQGKGELEQQLYDRYASYTLAAVIMISKVTVWMETLETQMWLGHYE